MKLGRMPQYALGLIWTLGAVTLGSRVALAADSTPPEIPQVPIEKAADSVEGSGELNEVLEAGQEQSEENKQPVLEQETFISDGSPIMFDHLDMSLNGIEGWEAVKNGPTMTLILQDPNIEKTKIGKDDFKFQRNLTVVSRHAPRPIDKETVARVADELKKSVEKDTLITEFQILESRFFDYNGQKDGLMIYSTMNIGPVPMLQIHVLVSGQANHFFMTYTDIAERFNSDRPTFERVWNSMMSINVVGAAPHRYLDLAIKGGVILAVLLLLTIVSFFRRKRASRAYASLADTVYDDDDVAVHGDSLGPVSMVWNLADTDDGDHEISLPATMIAGALSQEKTKQASGDHAISSVSNYF